nr:unnamed protein product [Spirometra erinaceieuropaei]
MDAAALTQRVLEQFVAGVRDPEVRKALMRGQPATLDKALDLARQEEALQAVCDRPAQPLLGIAAVRPQTVRDSATQTPWRPCSCGSYCSRQNQWRRPPPRRPNGPQNRRYVQSIDVGPQDSSDTTLDVLAGNVMFSTLDLASGYWQVEVRPSDREKTAFAVPSGLYEFETMPFGLANAPSTFQRLMNQLLAQLIPTSCLVYMDDIIVLGKDFDSHLSNIRAVFSSLRQAGLTLKPAKCVFIKPRVKFLGHVVSAAGIETDDEKVTQIREWPTPSDVTEVRSFLGLASYYRRFIKDYAQIAGPLHKLTQKNVKFKWTADCTNSFQTLKDKLCTTPILVFPDISNDAGKFILDTDASDTAIGAVLSQQQLDGTERVLQYLSRSLTKAERRYCVTRKEMLALTHFVEECRPYLQYRPFVVRTDHSALTWLRNFRNPEGQVARWQEKLAEYDFECVFRPGRQHGNADALSRKPHRPHGECPSCTDITISAIALQSDQCLLWAAAQRDDPHVRPIYDRKVSNGSILVTLSMYSWADKRPNTNWRQAIRDLELSYPGQNSRLWTVIRSVMQTLSPGVQPFAVGPLVILLLPNSPSPKAAGQQSLLPAKFTDFVQNLSQVLAQLNSAGSKDCVALNFSDLTSHHLRPHDATRQSTMKKLLLGKLQSEYDRNFRCFHIPGLDLLPGDVVLGLHGVSDYHSSPFKSSILIFSLTKPPPCEWPNDFRKMETCVRRLFHTLWDHSLGEEEVAALISRFTGRLAVFT